MSSEDPNTTGGPPPTLRDPNSSIDDPNSEIFFAAIETTRMPMVITDPNLPDHPIVFCNHAFSQMSGYPPEEIIGRNCRFLQGPDTDRAAVAGIRTAVGERRGLSTELLNYRKDGSSFWNALFISPVLAPDGSVRYFFGSQLDVTRRREAEDALRQAQKMEAIGQLTGGIAHDFNNVLQVIVGYAEMARSAASRIEQPRLLRSIEQIQAAADRASTLTAQLLAFSRKQRLEGRALNLNGVVEGMAEMAARATGDAVTREHRLAGDLWTAKVDAVQAEVALLNLIINARDAMPGGGHLTVTTANVTVAEGDPAFPGTPPGRYATVAIGDTGTGIPPDILSRVMDPFFTTKEEGKGTGLGLSMVYGFMKQSGGSVRIRSEVGRGTTVVLLFPATAERVVPTRSSRAPRRHDGGTETILVVEDRKEIATLAGAVLEELGYVTHHVGDAHEALSWLGRGEKVDLLFTDLVMPGGMNGIMLAREARRRRPDLRVLLTTGYADGSIERGEGGGGNFDLLIKPYKPAELARKVRDVLDAPSHRP